MTTDTAGIRNQLIEELVRLRARAGRIEDHQHNHDRDVPQDWEELATFREDDEVVDALEGHTKARIAEIAATLRRIDAGTWGTCTHCENQIGAQRLAALPTVAECVRCAAARD